MQTIKINFEVSENEINMLTIFPDYLNKEEKGILSEKTSSFLSSLQTGNLMSMVLHSIVEAGIITDNKNFSDLIIKKLFQTLSISSEDKPLVSPSEAFVFKEKQ